MIISSFIRTAFYTFQSINNIHILVLSTVQEVSTMALSTHVLQVRKETKRG